MCHNYQSEWKDYFEFNKTVGCYLRFQGRDFVAPRRLNVGEVEMCLFESLLQQLTLLSELVLFGTVVVRPLSKHGHQVGQVSTVLLALRQFRGEGGQVSCARMAQTLQVVLENESAAFT